MIVDDNNKEPIQDNNQSNNSSNDEKKVKFPEVVAITACPTGIAHTYMAKEKILQAAKELNMTCKVETQGRSGNDDVLSKEEIDNAKVIILAADKALIGLERFNGKKVLEVGTKDAIINSKKLITDFTSGTAKLKEIKQAPSADGEAIDFSFDNFKHITKNLLAGVSRMLPFVVAGGIILGIGFLIDSGNSGGDFGTVRGGAAWFSGLGKVVMSMMLPVLGAYICYAIVGPQGLLPGMICGLIADAPAMLYSPGATGWANTWGRIFPPSVKAFNSGFFGAIIGAYLAAFVVYGLSKGLKKTPKSLRGVKDIVFVPVVTTLAAGVIMFVINIPLGYLNYGLGLGLSKLAKYNLSALAGLIIGVMIAADMGGPINKAAYVFATLTLDPKSEFKELQSTAGGTIFMASAMIAGMVPPLAIALSTRIFKKYWSAKDVEGGNTNWFMAACFITEGAIPYAAEDPKRVITSNMIGSGIVGLLTAGFGVTLSAPHGGIFVFPLLGIQDNGTNWFKMSTTGGSIGIGILIATLALFIGALTSATILGFWRKASIKKGTLKLN